MTEVRCPKTIVLLCKGKFIAMSGRTLPWRTVGRLGIEEHAQEKSGGEFHLSVLTRSEIDARLFARAATSNRLDAMRHRAGNYSVFENSNAMRDTISFRPSCYRAATLSSHIQKVDQSR